MRHLTHVGEVLWLEIARRELGVKELAGKASNPRIETYHSITKAGSAPDDVAWCASFVGWCIEQAGIRSTRNKSASSYLRWGVECDLQPGAVVVLSKADKDAGGTGHVAFLVGVEGDDILILGGNQNNAVNVARRPRDRVVSARWPLV